MSPPTQHSHRAASGVAQELAVAAIHNAARFGDQPEHMAAFTRSPPVRPGKRAMIGHDQAECDISRGCAGIKRVAEGKQMSEARALVAGRHCGPVGRDEATVATYALSRPTPYDHELTDGYDLRDPLVATATGAAASFERCTDETGARLDCTLPALGGDVMVRGTRDGRFWSTETAIVVEREDLVCERDEEVCTSDVPVTVPVAHASRPPTLYLNAFGWDLATGEGKHVKATKKEFCRLIKGARLLAPEDEAGFRAQ